MGHYKKEEDRATADMARYARIYRQNHLEEIREAQREYYRRHKGRIKELKKERRIYKDPNMEERLKLIQKIEGQGGNVDFLDSLRIIDCYTEIYNDRGRNIDGWDCESQIIYMFHKLKTFKVDTKKICALCKRELDISCFSINRLTTSGLHSECKECINEGAKRKREGLK